MKIMHPAHMLYWLIVGHFVMDFWAQSDALARMKNRNRRPEVPPGQTPMTVWPYALTAHASMHGAAVALITGSWYMALFETATHWLIDFGKCENKYGIHADQFLHLCSKLFILYWMYR